MTSVMTPKIPRVQSGQQGFTLIELMIVIAIIGILAAVAVPQYRDYTIQARMAGVINFASMLKTEAMSHYVIHGEFPHSGGFENRKIVNSEHVSALEHWAPDPTSQTQLHIYVQPGLFPGATTSHAMLLVGTADATGHVSWNCQPHESFRAIDYKYLPGECVD